MAGKAGSELSGWRGVIPAGVRPYVEPAPFTALFLGISSGFPFALLAATLTQRLSEAGIEKKSISAFALALLVYSFKWLWAPLVDRIKLPDRAIRPAAHVDGWLAAWSPALSWFLAWPIL